MVKYACSWDPCLPWGVLREEEEEDDDDEAEDDDVSIIALHEYPHGEKR